MYYALTSAQMKRLDLETIEHYGVPSLVLMERAALAVYEEAKALLTHEPSSVLVVAGTGNNGADAIATARMLHEIFHDVSVVIVGDTDKASDEFRTQLSIAEKIGLPIESYSKETELELSTPEKGKYDLIIDGVFGIGCSRELEGVYKDAVMWMNRLRLSSQDDPVPTKMISVDIPSGINADNGHLMGEAVRADITVTFHAAKAGHFFYPGAEYRGKLVIADIGILSETRPDKHDEIFYLYTDQDAADLIPERKPFSHKGDYGKLLIIAGSREAGGCAVLAAKAALSCGAGMVRVFTHENNRSVVLSSVPEALIDVYGDDTTALELESLLKSALEWSDAVVTGPGCGTDERSAFILKTLLTTYGKEIVADADSLNLIAKNSEIYELARSYKNRLILTPHAAEFARLIKRDVDECRKNAHIYPKELADMMHATVLMKDAVSVCATPSFKFVYLNLSGNNGMATAGSGDVLAGIIGAFTVTKDRSPGLSAAYSGAYIHGLAGDHASSRLTPYAVTASKIIASLPAVFSGEAPSHLPAIFS